MLTICIESILYIKIVICTFNEFSMKLLFEHTYKKLLQILILKRINELNKIDYAYRITLSIFKNVKFIQFLISISSNLNKTIFFAKFNIFS